MCELGDAFRSAHTITTSYMMTSSICLKMFPNFNNIFVSQNRISSSELASLCGFVKLLRYRRVTSGGRSTPPSIYFILK